MAGLKCSRNKNFSLTHHKRNWRNVHWLAVRASQDETSDAFGKCILLFQRAFHREEYHQANNTINKFLWKRYQCPRLLHFYVPVILNGFDKTFVHGFLPNDTDVMFSHGTFATATVISFSSVGKFPCYKRLLFVSRNRDGQSASQRVMRAMRISHLSLRTHFK